MSPNLTFMKKLCLLICLLALPVFPLSAEENETSDIELPTEAALLIQKLDAWEENQERMYLQSVEKKREEVAKALDAILQEFTQRGKLAEALVIDKKIKKLRAPLVAVKSEDQHESLPDPNWFVGKTWEHVTRNEDTFTFHEDGTGTRVFEGNDYKFFWKLEGEFVEMKFDKSAMVLFATLEERGESMIARSKDGKENPIPVQLRR